jgi:hypothetical protein
VLEYYMGGQTLGKRWLGIRVIKENGQGITFLASLIRNLFRLIDNLPFGYFLGGLVCFFHPGDKRIGDMVAGTIVVRENRRQSLVQKKRLDKEWRQWNPDRLGITLDEEAKRRIDRKDWQMLSSYIERLPLLTDAKKRELGTKLARHLVDKGVWEDKQIAGTDPVRFLMAVFQQVKEEWQM